MDFQCNVCVLSNLNHIGHKSHTWTKSVMVMPVFSVLLWFGKKHKLDAIIQKLEKKIIAAAPRCWQKRNIQKGPQSTYYRIWLSVQQLPSFCVIGNTSVIHTSPVLISWHRVVSFPTVYWDVEFVDSSNSPQILSPIFYSYCQWVFIDQHTLCIN